MGKLDKKDKFNLFWIIIIYLGIALTITHGEYIFGSRIDWGYQHFSLPHYFRMLFYETGDLFPDFALNIGGGQNIFYFAYYGLFSPIILISYLLPFVPMSLYIAVSSLILGVLSIILFYIWIKGFNFEKNLCLVLTCLFALASPLLFHSHRHVMFVNYMPFLIMGLIGVRNYFKNGKKGMLVISVFLMIMTSFLYSVGGIICLTIYAIYEYLNIYKFEIKDFIKKGFNYALLIILGIMMSAILLLPVIYALKNGREVGLGKSSLLKAILPSMNLEFILYKPYSIGLTAISLLSILYLIFKRKERFLGIALSIIIIFPIFVYLLNGGLYLNGKVLIPFLPLYVLAIGLFLNDKINYKLLIGIFILCILWAFLIDDDLKWKILVDGDLRWVFLVDGIGSIALLFLSDKFKKKDIINIGLIVISVCVCLSVNFTDELISGEDFGKENSLVINEITKDITKEDKGFYRIVVNLKVNDQTVNYITNINENLTTIYSSTYNVGYNEFYYQFNNNRSSRNMFVTNEVKNTLFESYMGVKYLITDKAAPLGYKKWRQYGNYTVYINKNTLPVGYVTDRVISIDDYKKLNFPDDSISLIGNIVGLEGSYKYESKAADKKLDLMDSEKTNLKIKRRGNGYKVTVTDEEGGTLRIRLDESVKNKFYLLRFNMSNPQSCEEGDTNINVNGINNKLTCKMWKYFNGNYTFDYTLSSTKRFRYLNITFSKGVHYIDSVDLKSVNYDDLINDVDEFKVTEVKGDKIKGKIDVTKNGYFTIQIPYDKGFEIKLDGKKIKYEKVNNTFIGFKIKKGSHKIEIEYHAPNALMGKVVSGVGIVIFVILMIYESKAKD